MVQLPKLPSLKLNLPSKIGSAQGMPSFGSQKAISPPASNPFQVAGNLSAPKAPTSLGIGTRLDRCC